MAFSLFAKKKQQAQKFSAEKIRSIQVLGSGCKSCHAVYEAAKKAAENLDLQLEVAYITDMETIASYGIMRTPALMVNGETVSAGRVLTSSEVEKILRRLQK